MPASPKSVIIRIFIIPECQTYSLAIYPMPNTLKQSDLLNSFL
ncbi:Uncharacterized protein dnm_002960 [Desulfonema magnum]|uniref:Uncharacterized protein n=1 Tax=Desulfonema magnum TaxID=45655 RepID=A0A975BF70_9BACT|nr:Uncharacterized protein dnm_002960 [Desulfonema magnum]